MDEQPKRSPASGPPLERDRVAARARAERRCLTCGRDCDHAPWCWRGADAGPQWDNEQRAQRERDDLAKAREWQPAAVELPDLAWLERYRVAS